MKNSKRQPNDSKQSSHVTAQPAKPKPSKTKLKPKKLPKKTFWIVKYQTAYYGQTVAIKQFETKQHAHDWIDMITGWGKSQSQVYSFICELHKVTI